MRRIKWILLIFLSLTAFFSCLSINVEGQETNLEVIANNTVLRAGFNTTIVFTIINNFEPLYDVNVEITFPQSQTTIVSPTVIGTNNWRIDEIREGKSVTITSLIFVTEEAAGNGYYCDIVISYNRLGYISTYTETHTIGFYAKGEIEMVAYDFIVEPEPVTAGSSIEISGNLLNKGNVEAIFTNVTLKPNPVWTLQSESNSYLGAVDPNSPAPFTLEASINPDTEEGSYTVTVRVEYEDEESMVHIFEREVEIYVTGIQEVVPKTGSERIIEPILNNLLFILIGIVAIIIIVIWKRRRSSSSEFESERLQT